MLPVVVVRAAAAEVVAVQVEVARVGVAVKVVIQVVVMTVANIGVWLAVWVEEAYSHLPVQAVVVAVGWAWANLAATTVWERWEEEQRVRHLVAATLVGRLVAVMRAAGLEVVD